MGEEEEEQKGCGWGWVVRLTALDLAGWLAVTHTTSDGVSLQGLYSTYTHTQLACTHIMHHVSMWKQTTMCTHVFRNMSHTVWTALIDSLWTGCA